ncbi:MAG: DNA repair exonuclease, partial [Gammaproteobacteria bacterium]
FVALDVVRWHQLELALDGADTLAAVAARFHAAAEPLLAAAPDRLHALRVTLSGTSTLHALEARSPGTLAAQVQAAAQDLVAAEVWIEQVRVKLAAPFARAAQVARDDAIGELVRLVDDIAADAPRLEEFVSAELGRLLRDLPPELGEAAELDVVLDDVDGLRALLADAEATVLARLLAERDA